MPVTGEVTYERGVIDIPGSGLWSLAERTKEIVKPGYYSVPLMRYGIKAEMTATARVGLHRYTFPESSEAAIVFDLENGGCWDESTETFMQAEGNNRIVGYRYSKGWAKNQRIYFAAEFAKPFDSFELKGYKDMYGRASFATTAGEEVMLKVAISPVSIDGAKLALESELPGWDFEAVQTAAVNAWESELARIKVEIKDPEQKKIFYTAMYHAMIAPMLFSDINGLYDSDPHTNPDARLLSRVEELTPEILAMAGGAGTARETMRRLECAGLLSQGPGEIVFENSLEDPEMIKLCERLLTEAYDG
jgi:putative alpha-1,2-mannosidase